MAKTSRNYCSRAAWIIGLAGLLFVTCCGLPGYFIVGIGQSRLLTHGIGPVQVIGGPDEAWLFLEKKVVVDRPGWDEPPLLSIGCRQQIVVITPTGIKQRINVSEGKEVTFHSNITRIFRHEDRFYQIRGQSLGWHASLLRWNDDHFELRSRDDYKMFVAEHNLDSKLPEFDPKLDHLTESEGWEHLLDLKWWSSFGKPESFDWADKQFELAMKESPGKTALTIRCLGPGDRWEAVLIEFDPTPMPITREEYLRLRNEPEVGHKRK